jgi:hypothetical protein
MFHDVRAIVVLVCAFLAILSVAATVIWYTYQHRDECGLETNYTPSTVEDRIRERVHAFMEELAGR